MVKPLVVDSSVFLAALKQDEPRHQECRRLFELIQEGWYIAIEPLIVLVEVVAAIRRRTGSETLAGRVRDDLLQIETIYFLELIVSRAIQATNLAIQTALRGMDAIVVQVGKELGCPLVTLDAELAERAQGLVSIADITDLIRAS